MTVFEISICLGALAMLSVIISSMLSTNRRYQRDEELLGRPIVVRTTHRI